MKRLWIFTFMFFFFGIGFITAQEIITMRKGNMVIADILEITPSEISYKRFENRDGPTYVIPAICVNSIRYIDGNIIIINSDTKHECDYCKNMETAFSQKPWPRGTLVNNNKPSVGINVNAGGLIPLGDTLESGGPSLNVEFIKNSFYSVINLSLPIQNGIGVGFSGLFHYLWKSRIGDFYLGGGLGYTYHNFHFFTFGVNAGYRYATSFGMFFIAGAYIGGKLNDGFDLDFRPVLGAGYSF